MSWLLFLFGFTVYLPHDTLATETATPAESEEEIIVRGYVNYYGTTILRIITEEVSWYDARDICEQADFGKLDNSSHYHMKTSMITAALEEFGIGSNISLSLWTGYFRSDMTSDDWFSVCNEDLCYSSELTFDSENEGDQCVVNTYFSPFEDPLLETKDCSDKFSFVCVRWHNDATNFTKYLGHDFVTDPANSSQVVEFVSDFLSCINICAGNGFCVGASHNDVTGECRRVNAVYGFQYLQYPIVYVGGDVSHYTKAGINVILIDNSNYASETSVEQHFECPPTRETTTLVAGSSSTTVTPTSVESGDTEEVTDPTTFTPLSTVPWTTTDELSAASTSQATGRVSMSSTNTATTLRLTSSSNSETVSARTFPSTVSISSSTATVTASQTSTTLSGPVTSTTTASTGINQTTTSLSATATTAYCACNFTMCRSSAPLNETEITELVQMLVRNLTVARKETFKFKSMLVCSEDNRTSARAMGYVAAIVMCFVFGPIFISDIIQLFGFRW